MKQAKICFCRINMSIENNWAGGGGGRGVIEKTKANQETLTGSFLFQHVSSRTILTEISPSR